MTSTLLLPLHCPLARARASSARESSDEDDDGCIDWTSASAWAADGALASILRACVMLASNTSFFAACS